MSMTTRSFGMANRSVEQRDAADNGPQGAAGLKTVDAQPSENNGVPTQSPASLPIVSGTIAQKASENDGVPTQSPSGLKARVVATVTDTGKQV